MATLASCTAAEVLMFTPGNQAARKDMYLAPQPAWKIDDPPPHACAEATPPELEDSAVFTAAEFPRQFKLPRQDIHETQRNSLRDTLAVDTEILTSGEADSLHKHWPQHGLRGLVFRVASATAACSEIEVAAIAAWEQQRTREMMCHPRFAGLPDGASKASDLLLATATVF